MNFLKIGALVLGLLAPAVASADECVKSTDFETAFIAKLDSAHMEYVIEKSLHGADAVKAVVIISEYYGNSPPDTEMDQVDFIRIPDKQKILVVLSDKGCFKFKGIINYKAYDKVVGQAT